MGGSREARHRRSCEKPISKRLNVVLEIDLRFLVSETYIISSNFLALTYARRLEVRCVPSRRGTLKHPLFSCQPRTSQLTPSYIGTFDGDVQSSYPIIMQVEKDSPIL